jgi:hypothetical protein
MGQNSANVDTLFLVFDTRNQPVVVAMNIKNGQSSNLICGWKVAPQIGEVPPICMFDANQPRPESALRRPMLFPKFTQTTYRDDAHGDMLADCERFCK